MISKWKQLDAYSTAFILKMYRSISNTCHSITYYDEIGDPEKITIPIGGYYYTANELKAYLSSRPHVMNKKESKADRIARKKSGISRKEK